MEKMTKKHRKHSKLERVEGGDFHRLEFGFLGAPCSTIQNLCEAVTQKLDGDFGDFKIAYVDADHGKSEEDEKIFSSLYTDKISFHRFDIDSVNKVINKTLFNESAAVFVNGNHFKTDRQILILNNAKEESLKRKLDRIDKVELIVMEDATEVFAFLKEHLQEKIKDIEIVDIKEIDKIANRISSIIKEKIPVLNGLVFIGGKSVRMGEAKENIIYHKEPQAEHLAKLISHYTASVKLAGRKNQDSAFNYPIQEDTFEGLGPMGGILTAFQKTPNQALLTVPCDAPLIDDDFIKYLVANRNSNKVATCYYNPETNFPEPLICIWEPRVYPILLSYLSWGYSCPRKVLINSEIELLKTETPIKMMNVNTPEDKVKVLDVLG